ncbi:hypothetical protein [Aureimonas sp. SK2]|uniref:hypothetical protein n=1 Tax=Aureimonas sp. SK2 TaxID=3015992 RepID=UPI0024440152|nr:hypothetical protein [Aureimonas sp. SK2]
MSRIVEDGAVTMIKFDGTLEAAEEIVAFAGLPETAIVLGEEGPTSIHVEVHDHLGERNPARLMPGQILVRIAGEFWGIVDPTPVEVNPKVEMLARMWVVCDPNRGGDDIDELQGFGSMHGSHSPSRYWVSDQTGKPKWHWFIPRAEAILRFLDE